MPFDPKTDFFLPDGLAFHPLNRNDEGGIFEFSAVLTSERADMLKCYDKNGRAKNLYRLDPARDGAPGDRVRAYWCPYEHNRTRYTTLTLDADYMFTAMMDGCTFGVGHAASDGSVTVTHANAQNMDQRGNHAPMIQAQKDSTLARLGPRAKLFEPTAYRSRGYLWKKNYDVSALTFGVKEGRKWVFYSHRYRKIENGSIIEYKYYETLKIS